MGQQYAERFPHRVRAMTLDSNMDHRLGIRRFLATQTDGAQGSFDEFVAWCDRDSSCPLHGDDLRGVWHDLLARADRGELLVEPGPVAVTAFELINAVFSGLYGPHWHQLAELLVTLDQPAPAPTKAVAGHQLATGLAAEADVSAAPFQAIFCQDWDLPVPDHREFARQLRQLDRIAPDMRCSPLAVYATVACLGWPSEVTNPQQPLRVPVGPQLLLTSAVHDPSTPYAWTLGALSQLRRHASLLTYEGWGHGVYGRSDCTTGTIDTFLVSLHRPAQGASCPGVEPAPAATPHRVPTPDAVTVPPPEQPRWWHRD
nr:alpha/beta fold hydrolase [Natronosporangium hydrolyticum]